ncbi:MAG: phosphatidylglycerophosphatase A [Acidobacteria bacterium]|nr:phosphatidylglycerophosphatase A [Acidobacteriota bacterium]
MNRPSAPEAPVATSTSASRAGVWLASGFGLGHVPVAPGTAGSLAAVVVFGLLYFGLDAGTLQIFYLLGLTGLAPLALWSSEQALIAWGGHDPQAVVIDEILGQWLACGALVVATMLPTAAATARAGWKYLLAVFILFRAFDVLKPFPIRRSERLAGATGIVVDDVLAGLYAGLAVLLLAWTGWLS